MPRVTGKRVGSVTPAQLLALQELAGGAALRTGKVAIGAGGNAAGTLRGLEELGYVRRSSIDLDGVTEQVWYLTPAGQALVGTSNGKGGKTTSRVSQPLKWH